MEEFDGMKGSRYSGYVCGILHEEQERAEIGYILDLRRREIYCDAYQALLPGQTD